MPLSALLTLVFALVLPLMHPAQAQQSPGELLTEATESIREASTLRFDIILTHDENIRNAPWVMRSEVVARIEDKYVTNTRIDARYRGEGISRNSRYVVTITPDEAQILDYYEKSEQRASPEEIAKHPKWDYFIPMTQWIDVFLDPDHTGTYSDENLTSLGEKREGRQMCDVVELDAGEFKNHIYIDRKTKLPARMDVITNDMHAVIRIGKLRTNTPAPTSTFEIKPAPRGFTTTGSTNTATNTPTAKNTDATEGSRVGDLAPGWTLFDSESKRHSLDDYEGELVLLDFWATWCGPCKRAMPGLQRMHKQYASEGLNVIGVNVSEQDPNDAVKYMKSHSFTYELLLNGDSLKTPYDVTGFPTFVLIDRDGTIIHRGRGFSVQGERELENAIREALDMPAKSFDIDSIDDDTIDNWDG